MEGPGLSGAQAEAAAVQAVLESHGQEVLRLAGRDATEAAVCEILARERWDVLYIAGHGVKDDWFDNRFGHLKLYEDTFELHEIRRLDLRGCELVVLSACETALGSGRRLEMGNSLARAFLAAGAKRVVASYWKVSDQATLELMSEYFKNLADGMDRPEPVDHAAALWEAMKRMRSNRERRSPYYWAPFGLIGPAW